MIGKNMIKVNSFFLVKMNNRNDIQIEHYEVEGVRFAYERKALVQVKQGVINTSYLACIVKDTKRSAEYENLKRQSNPKIYSPAKRFVGVPELDDIFAGLKIGVAREPRRIE